RLRQKITRIRTMILTAKFSIYFEARTRHNPSGEQRRELIFTNRDDLVGSRQGRFRAQIVLADRFERTAEIRPLRAASWPADMVGVSRPDFQHRHCTTLGS